MSEIAIYIEKKVTRKKLQLKSIVLGISDMGRLNRWFYNDKLKLEMTQSKCFEIQE